MNPTVEVSIDDDFEILWATVHWPDGRLEGRSLNGNEFEKMELWIASFEFSPEVQVKAFTELEFCYDKFMESMPLDNPPDISSDEHWFGGSSD